MARKMNKKTRNTLSGILVGVASVFAVINFADIPAEEVSSFVLTTLLFCPDSCTCPARSVRL